MWELDKKFIVILFRNHYYRLRGTNKLGEARTICPNLIFAFVQIINAWMIFKHEIRVCYPNQWRDFLECLLQRILERKHHCTQPSPSMKQCYRCSSYSSKERLLQRSHCSRHCLFLHKLGSDLPESLTRDFTSKIYVDILLFNKKSTKNKTKNKTESISAPFGAIISL